MPGTLHPRAEALIRLLQLSPHPEGGWYAEVHRSSLHVQPDDSRPVRKALTTIDFLLAARQFSAWHRVLSDEVWHLLEGGPLRLWLVPPTLDRVQAVDLAAAGPGQAPRQVVPGGWWQAAEPLGEFAYVGATVGPGFEFDDFAFGRNDTGLITALTRLDPQALRLL